LYYDLKDSIDLKTKTFGIKAIDLKYNIEKITIKLERQHKVRNRTIVLASLSFLIITICIFIFRDRKKKIEHKKQKKELLLKERKLLQKEKELIALNQKGSEQKDSPKVEQNSINLEDYQKQIQKNKADLTLLLNQIIDLQCKIFKRTKIFTRILELDQQKEGKKSKDILNNKEQEILKQEINNIFGTVIDNLQGSYPALTDDDLLLCCLSFLKLPNITIGMCFGSADTNKIKQRKFRIKDKMNGRDRDSLFNFIFPSSKPGLL